MKLFVIHRFSDRREAKALFKKTGREMAAKFELILLDSAPCEEWKDQAIDAISKAEAVVVYNRKSCEESENAAWEIKKAEESGVPVVDIDPNDAPLTICSKLKPLYELEKEFDECFARKDGSSR